MPNPWLTSDDIVASVKRRISFPASQTTFTDDEILEFANEEMFIAQVPSVLMYHEEYFVTYEDITLVANKTRYSIPNRAIGMRLRDVFYLDNNDNLYEMTRINPEDKAYFQRDFNSVNNPYPYYLEGNDIVLPAQSLPSPTGSLRVSFFIRPNQLVSDDNAAIISAFCETITVTNASVTAGDTVTINGEVFTAVAGAPGSNEFQIGGTSAVTASNLSTAINTNGICESTVTSNIIHLDFSDQDFEVTTSDTSAFVIPSTFCIAFSSIPTTIIAGSEIDFLQTKPGHKILGYDVEIPAGGVSSTSIVFNAADVPDTLVVGDYICLSNSAIIPQLPPDLHNVLAERTASRILAALGDVEGLNISNAKIQEMEKNQGRLLDNRVDGDPQKITARHSLLHQGKRRLVRKW